MLQYVLYMMYRTGYMVQDVWFRISGTGCLVKVVGYKMPIIGSNGTGCRVQDVCNRMSCTGCPVQDVLYRLFHTGCPVQDVLYRMSCTGCLLHDDWYRVLLQDV